MYDGKRSCVNWEIAIRQKYDYVESFSEGFALVEHEHKQSIIDLNGRVVIRNSFSRHIEAPIRCGRIQVSTKNGFGYLDTKGKIVIKPHYYSVNNFHHNRAVVSVSGGQYGVIDLTGNVVVPIERDYIADFSEGFALFIEEGLHGYMDINGNTTIEPQFVRGGPFSCGLARVLKQGRKFPCYVNRYGEETITNRRFSTLGSFCEGLSLIQQHGLFGYIDLDGSVVIEPQYTEANDFSEGFAKIQYDNNKYGFIDARGREVIDGIYPETKPFSEGVAPVRLMYQWGFINRTGKFVVKPMFTDVGARRNGLAPVCSYTGWGFIKLF